MEDKGVKAMRRNVDALAIQEGACNPSGLCHAIINACQEIRESANPGTMALRDDPAIRLMVHQLAYLCNVREIDDEMDVYHKLTVECSA